MQKSDESPGQDVLGWKEARITRTGYKSQGEKEDEERELMEGNYSNSLDPLH
jgi:hypothetical protein